MRITNDQMDRAIDRWRKMPNVDQLYRELAEDPAFKSALEAAYTRDPSFMAFDAAGWHSKRYNVPVPPEKPDENDVSGPGAHLLKPAWWK